MRKRTAHAQPNAGCRHGFSQNDFASSTTFSPDCPGSRVCCGSRSSSTATIARTSEITATAAHCATGAAMALTAVSPISGPAAAAKPTKPETVPLRSGGTWSARSALVAACWKLNSVCVRHQTRATCHTSVVNASAKTASEPETPPVRIHVRLRPNRAAVRSLIRPASGFATSANSAPKPVTMPNAAAAPGPAILVRCSVSSSCRGVSRAIRAPMFEVRITPTRRGSGVAAGPGVSKATSMSSDRDIPHSSVCSGSGVTVTPKSEWLSFCSHTRFVSTTKSGSILSPMGLRETKAARTRDQILDVAAELFLAQGYDETTMEQIAERAEIAPSTLYRYFPSKDLLILGRLTESLQLGAVLRARPDDEPIPQVLAATLEAALDSFHDEPRFSDLRHIIDISPVPRARLWDVFMQSRAELEAELGRQMGLSEDDLHVQLTARTTITIFEIVAERWWAGDHSTPRGAVLDEVLAAVDAAGIVLPAAQRRLARA